MKKLICFTLIAVMLTLWMPTCVSAQEMAMDGEIIPLENGGYILIEISDSPNINRATTTKSKSYTCYNGDDEIQWKATLNGSFTYDGRIATCTYSTCDVTIYDSHWYQISKSVWADGNIARATLEMGERSLGITILRETHNLSMVCDRYGNVS